MNINTEPAGSHEVTAQQRDVETVVFCVYEANPENAGQVIQLNKKSEVQIQSFLIWIFVLWVF